MAKGLGRGFSALFEGQGAALDDRVIRHIKLTDIEPNTAQPRKDFDAASLQILSQNIAQNGIIMPIAVRKTQNGRYEIIAGERRWRAARMAGLYEVPAVVLTADDGHALELALIENLQRENLNPLEEAEGYRMLVERLGITQEDVARRVGKSRPAVANAMRLLTLPDCVKEEVKNGSLSGGHARALLALESVEMMQKAVEIIKKDELSVRQTEALVKRMSTQPTDKSPRVHYLEELERSLSETLSRKVKIISGRKKGKIQLDYYGNEDLDQLIALLSSLYGK